MRWILVLLIGLLVTTASAQTEQPFLDTAFHPQGTQIEVLRMHGIVRGYGYGLYRPNEFINRAELLTILSRAVYGHEGTEDPAPCFTDFTGALQWFWGVACAAKEEGMLTGYPDGSFRGEKMVNLAEALAMAERAWQMPLPQYFREPDHWYDPYFDAVAARGIGQYFLNNPNHLLTRGDAAWLLIALGQPLQTIEASLFSSSLSSHSSVSSASSVSSVSSSLRQLCGNAVKEGAEQCDDGNRYDGDGCSSICIIVPEPIQHSAIRLDQRSLGTDTVVGGSSQKVLFSFDANARWQDAILTGLTFDPEEGVFTFAVNYRLYEDQDGDGRPETIAGSGLVRDNVLSFSDLGSRIFTSRGKRFEIRADLVQTTGSLALGFRTSDSAYVEAVGAIDGRQLHGIRTDAGVCPRADHCWIAVYTKDAAPVTISQRGNLFVTQAAQPVRNRQLLAGALSEDLLRLSFRATDEDILVRRLAVTGASDAVDELQFFDPASSIPFATAHASGCRTPAEGKFCAAVDFTARKDSVRDVIVRALLRSADDGAASGDAVTLTLSGIATGLDDAVEATGIASRQDLAQNDGDLNAEGEIFIGRSAAGANSTITGPVHDVTHAAIFSIANASEDSDGSIVPTGLRTIGVFRFAARDKPAVARSVRSVSINTVTFDVTATNVLFAPDSFVLVNMLAPSFGAPCIQTAHTAAFRVTCTGFVTYSVNTLMPFGEYVTLGLRGKIDDANTASTGLSLLQVSLSSVSSRGTAGAVAWSDGTTAFQWVDIPEAEIRSTLYRMP